MKKVLIPTKLDSYAAEYLTEKGYEVYHTPDTEIGEAALEHPDAEILIVRSEKVTKDIIDTLSGLKLVVRAGAGYNTIDTKYARRKNIDVMNTPGANSNAVAELVIAMMLAAIRNIIHGDNTTRAGKWEKKKLMGTELTGKKVGIIGLGNIGRLVVKRIQGFECKVLGYDPFVSEDMAEKMGIELASMEDIFAACDFISLHIPENNETRGIINKKYFSLMKNGAVLVNCARAGVINEEDLNLAKQSKKIIFCNDVYQKDAPGEKTVADVADLMLPHLGASTKEANFNAARQAAEQTTAYFEKGVTNCVVNKGVPDGLDAKYQELAFTLSKLAKSYLGKDAKLHQIETSFYGTLGTYSKWMLSPIAAGIAPDFDIFQDASDAEAFLKERGIVLNNRTTDSTKKYGESMTLDFFEGGQVIRKISVRGTIAENNLMISRINDFDKLYLEASGHNLFMEYSDAPGVIGKIASILGSKGINIIDIRAPQNIKADKALAIIKTQIPVTENLAAEIKDGINADNAFTVSF